MPNVRAAIVGDGPLRADMQRYAEGLCVNENVEFLGQRKDVEAILARSKIFVLTSKSEGLSIAMAEAMASGVVPVVADVGELGDLVIDGANGYLVAPDNIDEYVKRIILLLQDQYLWKKYSRRATEEAKKHCEIDVVTKKWRHYLRDVVEQVSGHVIKEVLKCTKS